MGRMLVLVNIMQLWKVHLLFLFYFFNTVSLHGEFVCSVWLHEKYICNLLSKLPSTFAQNVKRF